MNIFGNRSSGNANSFTGCKFIELFGLHQEIILNRFTLAYSRICLHRIKWC